MVYKYTSDRQDWRSVHPPPLMLGSHHHPQQGILSTKQKTILPDLSVFACAVNISCVRLCKIHNPMSELSLFAALQQLEMKLQFYFGNRV